MRDESGQRGLDRDAARRRSSSKGGRGAFAVVCSCLIAGAALVAGGAPSAGAAGPCANEEVRQQQGGSYLPGCRAYEMVSPLDKAGYDVGLPINAATSEDQAIATDGINFTAAETQAAPDGDTVTFKSIGGFAGIQSSTAGTNTYIARRGPSGWVTGGASMPFLKDTPGLSLVDYPIPYTFTEDLSSQVVLTPYRQMLASDERVHDTNLFARDNLTGAFELRTPELIPDSEFPRLVSGFGAASADLSHLTFITSSDVVPGLAGGKIRAYESYLDGSGDVQLRLVSVLPDDQPATEASSIGALAETGANRAWDLTENSISRDGSRIVWFESNALLLESACTPPGPLRVVRVRSYGCPTKVYLREDGTTTRDVSEPVAGTPVDPTPGPGEIFWAATPDVDSVFFTAQRNLTPDANADSDTSTDSGSFGDLYRYRPDGNGGEGELIDVTPDTVSAAGAQVLGVLGIADDGDRVYFVARSNRLDGEQGVQGEANLYLWSANGGSPETTYVATLDAPTSSSVGGAYNWTPSYQREAMATSSGDALVFSSRLPAGGAETAGTKQVFHYDAATDSLSCVSCPEGAPTRDAQLPGPARVPFIDHHPRALTADGGRVFFESAESLVPLDGNGMIDVYEWDAATGTVALLSDGTAPFPSYLQDSTPDGSNVFIATRRQLVGADVDLNMDLYDVRAGGGFLEPPVAAECVGDACKAAREAAPPAAAIGTAALSGATRGAGCAQPSRRATSLRERAKQLRRRAGKADSSRQAKQLRNRATRLDRQARQLKAKARQCRNAAREVGK